MDPKALDYLTSRGYESGRAWDEGIVSRPAGKCEVAGVPYKAASPHLAFPCRTPSGAVAGVHLAAYDGSRDYQWRQNPAAPYLPICYASPADWEVAWHQRELVLVEGVFDRVAVARALPGKAVVARLSKSIWSVQYLVARLAARVRLALDRDEQGERGAEQAERALSRLGVEVYRLSFRGKDPAEHAARHGIESLRRSLEGSALTEVPL